MNASLRMANTFFQGANSQLPCLLAAELYNLNSLWKIF
jgi:hypothetical protein